jgi:DNA-binding phage protein
MSCQRQKKIAAVGANQENTDGEQEVDADGEQQVAADGQKEATADGDLDVVEIFKECHTTRKKGMCHIAKEAILSLISLYTSLSSLIETVFVCKQRWLEM